jgi:hypothetical protein
MPSVDPLDPEVLAALDAIDATLHGEPVDPEHAELAELALILRDERPAPDPAFLTRLDRQVQARFATPVLRAPRRRAGRWTARWREPLAAVAGLAALCVAVIVLAGGGSSGPAVHQGAAVHRSASGAPASSGPSAPSGASTGGTSTTAASSAGAAGGGASNGAAAPGAAPLPRAGGGRDLTQSARVGLEASPGGLAAVAQEVFDVIGDEHGVVLASHVTQTSGGPEFATFSLKVTAGRLEITLDRLSRLRHARVTSREDVSADVTARVDNTRASLAAERATRRSLLGQLAATDVAAQADRLQREAARVLRRIDREDAMLAALHHRVLDSTIGLTLQSPPVIHRAHRSTGAFTFTSALHDAGHILLLAAGVALIALAVLVPLGLVVVICAWVWSLVLRRRREGVLGPS